MGMTVPEFIGEHVRYDDIGGSIFGGLQLIADIRGWGAIQNLFKDGKGMIDTQKAAAFQDQFGQWIADAINEKLQREKEKNA